MLQSSAADVRTVLVNGEVRKRDGVLVGPDLDAVRTWANAALHPIEKAASLPEHSSAEIHGWFMQAERAASVNFAGAYARN
ncbi:hypothetical protein AB0I53_25495 [Saccharopolyspora sp. NPDC050389]|uniref:hypothetical protein n=1 Tax=Saccharopolyspora sp. NPDC050389 TaxID=3155516 RepID=UPI0033E7C10D